MFYNILFYIRNNDKKNKNKIIKQKKIIKKSKMKRFNK